MIFCQRLPGKCHCLCKELSGHQLCHWLWWEHSLGWRELLFRLLGLFLAFLCLLHVITTPKPLCPLASSGFKALVFTLPHPCCPSPSSPTSSAGMPRDTSRTWTPRTLERSAFPSAAAGGWPLPKLLSVPAVPLPHHMLACPPAKGLVPARSLWAVPAASCLLQAFSRHLRGPDGHGLNSLQASDPCGWHKAVGQGARRLPSSREPKPAPAAQPLPKPTDLSFLS